MIETVKSQDGVTIMSNLTSEVEQRVRKLFVLLRAIVNDAAKAAGLPRVIAEDSSKPWSVLFHIGNRAANLDKLTGPNVAKGRGVTVIWPDQKNVTTKRQCGTCWLPSGLNDDATAAAIILQAMLLVLTKANAGTDNLPELIEGVRAKSGLTKGGKLTKAATKALGEATANLGPWPVPGITKATVTREKQKNRGPIKAYCMGALADDGKPCHVDNERAKPSKWYQPFHPATAQAQVDSGEYTCWMCGGPIEIPDGTKANRKNQTVTEEIEI
jgi:hypothetical protein